MNAADPKIRVMLVDDHAVVRVGFRMLLAASGDVEVVFEADSGELAYQNYAAVRPDVVVMDLSMPGMGGIETVRRLLARDRSARVLVLSAHQDGAHPKRVLKAGALGYLSKRGAPEALIEAVRAVAAGRLYLDAEIARCLAQQDLGGAVDALSEREFAVFIQLARGQSVNRIAEVLKLSPNTVGTHLYHIKQKLGAGNQAELTLIALRNGLIEA
ncbi:response regulator transcription factor [Dokdonella sp.]|uniref:response regulator n=1 Tax=Dokdonella sp. TaxID=2291710 RepID=UPI001B183114|nr:response regulator transcription factor [Dokdonella sp.]MBO9663509.1 response regulator transcription factor [Dokdonella sp.]